jgi:Glycosyl transferase family 11
MILFQCNAGQLGNQIFNLAALDKLCHGRRIGVLFGCRHLNLQFHWRRRGVIISNRGGAQFGLLLRRLAERGLLSRYREGKIEMDSGLIYTGERLVSRVSEGRIETDSGLIYTGELVRLNRSFLPLTFVEDAFLQSDFWVRDDFSQMLTFREPTVRAVEEFAAHEGIDWESSIFVHVRRGDYLNWNLMGTGSPALPTSYYLKGIERIRGKTRVSRVIFVTDDPSYVEREFDDVPDKLVISKTAIFDMCVMAKCASGVMSASSFSWWGAILGPQRVAPVAPVHWLGWRKGVDFPLNAVSKRFDAISVEP